MSDNTTQTPESGADTRLAALIGPLLVGIDDGDRPAVIALAERIAGDRYRAWSALVDDAPAKSELLACAAREDEIASKVEAIVSKSAEIQAQVRAAHPGLADGYKALFDGMSLADQFRFQSKAERAGAALWRATAAAASTEDQPVYLDCAVLEEASATVLEKLIADGVVT